jgi:recombination protein RecT
MSTTNLTAEKIITMLQAEQAGFRELFNTNKAFDKFVSNFRLISVKNPEITECMKTDEGKKSLFTSLFQAANDGLLVDGKRSALVIFNTKDKSGVKRKLVQYMPMVFGIREIIYESAGVLIDAQIIYEGDEYVWEQGDYPKLIHKPSVELSDNPKPLLVYAVARKDGVVIDRVVMRLSEIDKIMKSSKSGFEKVWDSKTNSYAVDSKGNLIGNPIGIWKDHWAEMAKKTAVRRLSKQLPLSEKAEQLMDRIDSDFIDIKQTIPTVETQLSAVNDIATALTKKNNVAEIEIINNDFEIDPAAIAQAEALV